MDMMSCMMSPRVTRALSSASNATGRMVVRGMMKLSPNCCRRKAAWISELCTSRSCSTSATQTSCCIFVRAAAARSCVCRLVAGGNDNSTRVLRRLERPVRTHCASTPRRYVSLGMNTGKTRVTALPNREYKVRQLHATTMPPLNVSINTFAAARLLRFTLAIRRRNVVSLMVICSGSSGDCTHSGTGTASGSGTWTIGLPEAPSRASNPHSPSLATAFVAMRTTCECN